MAINSKYFDSIRITSTKKEKTEKTHNCAWHGCDKPGTNRAPARAEMEGQYLFFCLEHVREYNKNFNYFANLSEEEIAKFQKDALTGHRPTWPNSSNSQRMHTSPFFSSLRSGTSTYQRRVKSPHLYARTQPHERRKIKPLEIKALTTLGLEMNATADQIKAKYKALVKIQDRKSVV